MKKALLILLLLAPLTFASAETEKFSFGAGGGVSLCDKEVGAYYALNTLFRVDSSRGFWMRSLFGKTNLTNNSVSVATVTPIVVYDLAKWIAVGGHVGANYDALTDDFDGLTGIEVWIMPYDWLNVSVSGTVIEAEGPNRMTFNLFLNFSPK